MSRLLYVYLLTAFFTFLHFNYAEMFLVFFVVNFCIKFLELHSFASQVAADKLSNLS